MKSFAKPESTFIRLPGISAQHSSVISLAIQSILPSPMASPSIDSMSSKALTTVDTTSSFRLLSILEQFRTTSTFSLGLNASTHGDVSRSLEDAVFEDAVDEAFEDDVRSSMRDLMFFSVTESSKSAFLLPTRAKRLVEGMRRTSSSTSKPEVTQTWWMKLR